MSHDDGTPFAAITEVDHARLQRHTTLLAIWRDLPVDELLGDLSVLAQLCAFRAHQHLGVDGAVALARKLADEGGTHDCTEWCQVCGKRG
jgi:hypothetical protein